MTTITEEHPTIMRQAQARLDWTTNPIDQALYDALVGAAEFVDGFVPGCVGERDIPDTRMEPGYCECRIDGDEARTATAARQTLVKAVAYARSAALTDEQLPWAREVVELPERLPRATCELIRLAEYVALRLGWVIAGTLRSDVSQLIEELREELR